MKRLSASFVGLAAACMTLGLQGQVEMMPTVYVKTGKGQGHGKPGSRSKAERNARKAKRRQRAKGRR